MFSTNPKALHQSSTSNMLNNHGTSDFGGTEVHWPAAEDEEKVESIKPDSVKNDDEYEHQEEEIEV